MEDEEVKEALRMHIQSGRRVNALSRPADSDETAGPVLNRYARTIRELRALERQAENPETRAAIREHIEVARRLIRRKARQFHFAYVDPDDGEGGARIHVAVNPLPPCLYGVGAGSLPVDAWTWEEWSAESDGHYRH